MGRKSSIINLTAEDAQAVGATPKSRVVKKVWIINIAC